MTWETLIWLGVNASVPSLSLFPAIHEVPEREGLDTSAAEQEWRISLAKERLEALLSQAIPLHEAQKDSLEASSSNVSQSSEHGDAPDQDTTDVPSPPKASFAAMVSKTNIEDNDKKTADEFLDFLRKSDRILAEVVHLHISLSPSLPTEKDSPSSVLLDSTAYISAAAVSNTTTAVGKLSTGTPIQVSFCLTRPPRLSYICVHFPVSITWARV
uniref:Uncharacterized protein n=1 Tax=Setaria italica TaxID=4555 RepID=K3ZEF4_SETIT